ncbi:hypothetical protein [Jannaschia seohaensis]|uniref:hypothetical protein n=1 Tax=Jannaschia seohaensis TaxID=475081 RepID=UPI003CCC5968
MNYWKIIVQSRRQFRSARPISVVISVSPNGLDPELGAMSRLTTQSRVDLPAPEWPITPTNYRDVIDSDT